MEISIKIRKVSGLVALLGVLNTVEGKQDLMIQSCIPLPTSYSTYEMPSMSEQKKYFTRLDFIPYKQKDYGELMIYWDLMKWNKKQTNTEIV